MTPAGQTPIPPPNQTEIPTLVILPPRENQSGKVFAEKYFSGLPLLRLYNLLHLLYKYNLSFHKTVMYLGERIKKLPKLPIHTSVSLVALSIALACVSAPTWSAAGSMTIDDKTVKKWSDPFRGWHYHPDHVIPANPNIKGFEKVHMTDVPTVFQLPGDKKWYMTFIGFDGKGYQSFVAESHDLVNWGNRRLAMGYGKEGEFDFGGRVLGAFLYEDYGIKAPRTLKGTSIYPQFIEV